VSEDDTAESDDDWFESGLNEDDEADNWDDWATGDDDGSANQDEHAGETDRKSRDSNDQSSWADTEDTAADTTSWADTPEVDDSEDDTETPEVDDSESDAGTPDWADSESDQPADWTETVDAGSSPEQVGGEESEEGGGAFGGSEGGFDAGGAEADDDGLFDEGFSDAFGGTGDDSDFADEDFDSDIPRLDIGIEGLDEMIQGGVPRKHLLVVIGSAGTGKTTFGLQFLHHGLQTGENCVFITLEQSREAIVATGNERGWSFEKFEDEGRLAIVDLDPVEMANSLDNIQAELPELIEDFGADRLVLDSVSLLEMMYDDQAKRRTEVFDFTRSLKKAGVTTFLTSEASESNPYASRHGIIEYLTDAVFVLQYVRGETQETRLAVEIQKIRNANHSREQKPYEMTDEGISVYQQANIF
jgi:KaiC domain protein